MTLFARLENMIGNESGPVSVVRSQSCHKVSMYVDVNLESCSR